MATPARLRQKGKGSGNEVPICAYEAMITNSRLGSRMLEILMKGVSTRNYKHVLGYQQMWILDAKLKELNENELIDKNPRVA